MGTAFDVLDKLFVTMLWAWAPAVVLRYRHEGLRELYYELLPFAVVGLWLNLGYETVTHAPILERVVMGAMTVVWTFVWRHDDDDRWKRRRRRLKERVAEMGGKLTVVPVRD